mmetsp:Transcript_54886/g.139108  ORF Transcript_54886/g.139108 Transcript_54886/m.139108 type:complete len:124 (-) Transcript_54886:11-382(-)
MADLSSSAPRCGDPSCASDSPSRPCEATGRPPEAELNPSEKPSKYCFLLLETNHVVAHRRPPRSAEGTAINGATTAAAAGRAKMEAELSPAAVATVLPRTTLKADNISGGRQNGKRGRDYRNP